VEARGGPRLQHASTTTDNASIMSTQPTGATGSLPVSGDGTRFRDGDDILSHPCFQFKVIGRMVDGFFSGQDKKPVEIIALFWEQSVPKVVPQMVLHGGYPMVTLSGVCTHTSSGIPSPVSWSSFPKWAPARSIS
jgi:hypothetical protein